jgi:hypothetical protein
VIGGDQKGVSHGYTLDPNKLDSRFASKVALIVSPASNTGSFVKVEMTGEGIIHVAQETGSETSQSGTTSQSSFFHELNKLMEKK